MKVILVGYMGSGKSVVAQKLAAETGLAGVELDALIEKKAGMPIAAIFSVKSELYFRKLEHEIFTQYMQSDQSFVLSTGGGTPCYYNHHQWLKGEGIISVYLKASVETLAERLARNLKKRPLLAQLGPEELKEYIAKHLFDRSFYYHQAQHILSVDHKSVMEIVTEIRSHLT